MSNRSPTTPGPPTPETNFVLIDSLQRKVTKLEREKDALEELVSALRDRMIAVAGEDGKGGKLGDLLEKHDKSAASQGGRLEAHTSQLAVLNADRRILQVLGAIALLALGVLFKGLYDKAMSEKRPASVLPQPAQDRLPPTQLTPGGQRSDDAP